MSAKNRSPLPPRGSHSGSLAKGRDPRFENGPRRLRGFLSGMALAVIMVLQPLALRAELRVAQIFQDHMVLQRGKPAALWGWAAPGAEVAATFMGQDKTGKADGAGYWRVTFDPLTASAKGNPLTITSSGESKTLNDVVVGEVWICAGQSNMARTLRNDSIDYPFFKDYANDAEYPAIRFIRFQPEATMTPQSDFDSPAHAKDKWTLLSKSSAIDCMSVPLFFAKKLHKELNVPVGLIQIAVPGTPQTAWMAKETLNAVASEIPGSPDFQKYFENAEAKTSKVNGTYKSWSEFESANTASRGGLPPGERPIMADSGVVSLFSDYPSVLYNALVHPLAPLAIQGVLWHQGESGPGDNYKDRLIANLTQWRKLFGQDFFFLFGSIARNTTNPPPLSPESVQSHSVNEELLLAAQATSDDKLALINFCDLGNSNLHWAEREEAGIRMAGAAIAKAYGKTGLIYTGPELIEARVEGSSVIAKFRNTGSGLVYKPSINGISGFAIEEKGASPAFRWASSVKIEGDTVVISDPAIKNPTGLFYGWSSNPHETLFNKEGYTAFPFRLTPRQRVGKLNEGTLPPLVEMVSPAADQASLNMLHVSRDGFLFGVVKSRGPKSPALVKVRIPSEWNAAVISIDGKTIDVGQPTSDSSGTRVYTVPVEVNGSNVVVGNAANPPDFSKLDRF